MFMGFKLAYLLVRLVFTLSIVQMPIFIYIGAAIQVIGVVNFFTKVNTMTSFGNEVRGAGYLSTSVKHRLLRKL